jgi:hypothetical protein
MIRWSGIALVAVGILHVIVLGKDALPHVPDWLRLQLWTDEHWRPFEAQRLDILTSNAAFWATVGSFAVPMILLGALVIWLDRRGLPVPAFVGWALLAWFIVASLIIEASGFPLGIPIAACLILGASRQNRRHA